MLGRQSVRVTYAHRRRRIQNASKKSFSSPLEVLPPDMGDLTRTQMAHRMLKRSRRVALAEQLEDKNVEHIREHLAKRIKHTQECVSNHEPTEVPFDVSPRDDLTFQTPFHSSKTLHKSVVAGPLAPEQLSPVPVRRVMSRTSSRNLKENSTHSQVLASPFSSRPGSVAPSPKRKAGVRTSCRVSRISLHAKSRTLSRAFKENARQVSRKYSSVSLRGTNGEPSARHARHQRYPSSPSAAYMRSQIAQQVWITPPKAPSRTFDDYDKIPSPGSSVHSNTSFYADQPQCCSTPATSRLRNLSDLHAPQARTNSFPASFSQHEDSTKADHPDVEMIDDTVPSWRRAIHLSGNSIFSSSDEFTVGSLPATQESGITNDVTSLGEAPTRVARQAPAHEAVYRSQVGHSLAGSFVAEYTIPLPCLDGSPTSTAATQMFGPDGVPKQPVGKQLSCTSPARGEDFVIRASNNTGVPRSSVGERLLGLPGTNPAHGENLVIRTAKSFALPKSSVEGQLLGLPGASSARDKNLVICTSRNPRISKSPVGEQLLSLPGTSLARGENPVVHMSRIPSTVAPPASPSTTATCPPSPASDLALELRTMDICGNPDTRSDGETHRPFVSIPIQVRSHSVQDVPAESSTKKIAKRWPIRNRAGTIRASDFIKPASLSGAASGSTVAAPSNVRRTRSGTVVGPDSKLAGQRAKDPPAAWFAAVRSGSGSESDDELLLQSFWMEDLEYLGLAMPQDRKGAETDELNLGVSWQSLESRPARRPGLRGH